MAKQRDEEDEGYGSDLDEADEWLEFLRQRNHGSDESE
jgi:hypothetical protein